MRHLSTHFFPPLRVGNNYVFVMNNATQRPEVILGPHWPGVIFTYTMIFCGTALNMNMINEREGNLGPHYSGMLKAFAFVCALTSSVFLLLVATKDPGIILAGKISVHLFEGGSSCNDDEEMRIVGGSGGSTGARSTEEVSANEQSIKSGIDARYKSRQRRMRYCEVCDMDQARSADHCYDCGVCIERLDHHCPWMGKCIGRRNMSVFIAFNICWIVHLVEFLAVAVY
jgi:hypothetical protein